MTRVATSAAARTPIELTVKVVDIEAVKVGTRDTKFAYGLEVVLDSLAPRLPR
jgi:hypothetical protein